MKYVVDLSFYNISCMDLNYFGEIGVVDNIEVYVCVFSFSVCEIFEYFDFFNIIDKFDEVDLFYKVVKCFVVIDLYLDIIDNYYMGLVFEELICWFVESLNEIVGEYFILWDIVRLIMLFIFIEDNDVLI